LVFDALAAATPPLGVLTDLLLPEQPASATAKIAAAPAVIITSRFIAKPLFVSAFAVLKHCAAQGLLDP
jgi:hypothetical protein